MENAAAGCDYPVFRYDMQVNKYKEVPNTAKQILQQPKTNLWTSQEKGKVRTSRTLTFYVCCCSSFDDGSLSC